MSDENEIAQKMKELQEKVDNYRPIQVPWGSAVLRVGGTCGKCGAPYTYDDFGKIIPICACWNLPKIKTTTNTGEL